MPAASGCVADAQGRASREIVDRALAGLAAVSHRGAWAADGVTGDGAGLLLPLHRRPDGRGRRRHRHVLPPRAVAPRDRRGGVPRGGARAVRLARRPARRRGARLDGDGEHAAHRAARARAVRRAGRRAARAPRAPPGGAGRRRLRRLALVPHGDLQGALRSDPARRASTRTSPTRSWSASVGDLPPALLDEHRAELGAGAAVPVPLPQRRDQHDRGERRLDGGARARPRPRARARAGARSLRLGLRAPRQRARAARPRRARRAGGGLAARAARLAERSARRRRGARDAPLPRDARRAVGRSRRPRLHATASSCGAALDRNGLRPLRVAVCDDGLVTVSSEAGAIPLSEGAVVRRARLGPGPAALDRPRSRAALRRRAQARARAAQGRTRRGSRRASTSAPRASRSPRPTRTSPPGTRSTGTRARSSA